MFRFRRVLFRLNGLGISWRWASYDRYASCASVLASILFLKKQACVDGNFSRIATRCMLNF